MPFFGNSPTDQTRRRLFTHDGSNDAEPRKDVPFEVFFYIAPHLYGQKPLILGLELAFKSQTREVEKREFIIKTTASIPTTFGTVIKTTNCPSWEVPIHASQIQNGGRPSSWKNRKIVISRPRFKRF